MANSLDDQDPRVAAAIDRYWKKNISIMAVLLAVWAAAGLGAGILFADVLNAYYLGDTRSASGSRSRVVSLCLSC